MDSVLLAEHPLHSFFSPRGIAIVGASDGETRAGARTLNNLGRFGYKGGIYPVSRSHSFIGEYKCYKSAAEVPDPVDLAVLCVGAERVPGAIRECGERGIQCVVVYAGLAGNDELQIDLERAIIETGARVIGPNTIGYRGVIQNGVFATNSRDLEGGSLPGRLAVIAQSGGLGGYFGSAELLSQDVGTRYVIDTGSELNVSAADVLGYVAQDENVSCIAMILEGSKDGRALAAATKAAVDGGKPVVFLKTGRSAASSAHVATHTGAVAGSGALFEAAMSKAGAIVVRDEVEFLDAVTIANAGKAPDGRRLGIVTPSGGFAILAIDAAERYGMELPMPVVAPSADEMANLSSGELANPFDFQALAKAGSQTLRASLAWMYGQPNVDAVILWQANLLEIEAQRNMVLEALNQILPDAQKPLFICGIVPGAFQAQLREMGVLTFTQPSRLIAALSAVAPRIHKSSFVSKETTLAASAAEDKASVVLGDRARSLLDGLEHVRTVIVPTEEAAEELAERWGSIILKVEVEKFPHKTEVGLVSGITTSSIARESYRTLVEARRRCGEERSPIVAQPVERGVELALGGFVDPIFGASVMVAAGGINIELLRDVRVATAPLDEAHALELIESLQVFGLLAGLRGRPRSDINAAARALVALGDFMATSANEWQSIDVNPLIVRAGRGGAVAVDILMVPTGFGKEHD